MPKPAVREENERLKLKGGERAVNVWLWILVLADGTNYSQSNH